MGGDRETRKRLRQAYEEAWQQRTPGGDGEDVLMGRLRAHGLDEALDETSAINQHVLDLWRRRVPPSKLNHETRKLVGRAALHTVAAVQMVFRQFQESSAAEIAQEQGLEQLETMPAGRRGVTDQVHDPPSALLTLELSETAAPLLRQHAALARGLRGWTRAQVWLSMHEEQPRASVMLGDAVVGETRVPEGMWRSMVDAADSGLYADGFLDTRVQDGGIEAGTLLCAYLDDPQDHTPTADQPVDD